MIDIQHENREGLTSPLRALYLVRQEIHQMPPVAQSRQGVGGREAFEFVVVLAQAFDHSIEDLRQVPDFSAPARGQSCRQIAGGHLRRGARQAAERPRNEGCKPVGNDSYDGKKDSDDEKGCVSQLGRLTIGIGYGHVRHREPRGL
jgi:hypothetical protein